MRDLSRFCDVRVGERFTSRGLAYVKLDAGRADGGGRAPVTFAPEEVVEVEDAG